MHFDRKLLYLPKSDAERGKVSWSKKENESWERAVRGKQDPHPPGFPPTPSSTSLL